MHRAVELREPLQLAATAGDVRELVASYLASIPPDEIEALPVPCREALCVDDFAGSALTLLRAELSFSGDPAAEAMLHEIAHTFVAASNRIAAIEAQEGH